MLSQYPTIPSFIRDCDPTRLQGGSATDRPVIRLYTSPLYLRTRHRRYLRLRSLVRKLHNVE